MFDLLDDAVLAKLREVALSNRPGIFWRVAIALFPKPPAQDDSDQAELFARVQRAIDMIDAQKGVEVRTQVIVEEPPKMVDAVVGGCPKVDGSEGPA